MNSVNSTATLETIFPAVRAGILSAVLLEPRRWWFLSELARHLEAGPSSLQRELESLVESGILERREDGRRVYFRANADSPVFADLRGLVEKTAGVVPALAKALDPFEGRIELAFVYGSFARGSGARFERRGSDDRRIGEADRSGTGTSQTGRPVPDARSMLRCIHRWNFAASWLAGDHFLRSVLKGRTILLKGSPDELDKAAARRKGPPPHVRRK